MDRDKHRSVSPSKNFKDTRRLNNMDPFKDKNSKDSLKALFCCI